MSKLLKIFGVVCGILAFGFCACSGHTMVKNAAAEGEVLFRSLGFFIIGMGFFTGPMLILVSLRSGHSVSGKSKSVPAGRSGGKPARKSKPAGKKGSANPAAGGQSQGDLVSIYVGNLSPEANETVVRTAFSGFGEIKKIRIVKDRGRPKGFCFVDMVGRADAMKAIEAMNGEELAGRALKVNEAKPKGKGRGPQRSRKPQTAVDDEGMKPNIFE